MSNKRQKLYAQVVVFAEIKRIVMIEKGQYPEPQLVISDFETAILGAVAQQFPSSRARGCWFHFAQVRFVFLFLNNIFMPVVFRPYIDTQFVAST